LNGRVAVAGRDLSHIAPIAQRRARSERALVRDAARGSEEALAELFRACWPGAYRAAFLIVHDHSAAEDIAQEAIVAAIRNLGHFDRRLPLRPWLHRIVVNRAIDWTRVRTLRAEVLDTGETTGSAGSADARRYSDPVVTALAALPPDQRAVVVLRHLLEYTPGEIAQLLGMPRGTVNSRLRRGLDVLRTQLEDEAR
jgi:RNA polymerase sigma-70 factor (ECF subfamily)